MIPPEQNGLNTTSILTALSVQLKTQGSGGGHRFPLHSNFILFSCWSAKSWGSFILRKLLAQLPSFSKTKQRQVLTLNWYRQKYNYFLSTAKQLNCSFDLCCRKRLTKQQVKSQKEAALKMMFFSSVPGVSVPYLPACCSPHCASPRATEQPAPSSSQNPWILWPSPRSAGHKPCTQRSAGCISSSPAAQFGGCPQDLRDKGQTQLQQQQSEVGEKESETCSILIPQNLQLIWNESLLQFKVDVYSNTTHSVCTTEHHNQIKVKWSLQQNFSFQSILKFEGETKLS